MSVFFTILSCAVFLLSSINHSSEVILILFFLGMLFYAFKIRELKPVAKEIKYISYAFIAMFVTIIPNLFFNDGFAYDHFRSFNMQIAYVMASIVLVLVIGLKVHLNAKMIMYAICIGAYINGIVGIVQKVFFDVARVDGFTEIFEFAQLSAVLGLCVFAYFFKNNISFKERIIFGIAFILIAIVLIFNESRGIEISFACGCIVILLLYIFAKKERLAYIFKNISLLIILALIASGAFSFYIKESLNRFHMIKADLKEYEQKNTDTSIGNRFEMWKEALRAFRMSPIVGLNPKSLCEYVKYPNGESYPRRDCYQRLHSEFFNTLARKGILGILALFGVWISVGVFFAKRIKATDAFVSIFSISFMGILTLYIVSGAGNEPMIAFSEGNYFLLISIIFAAITYSHKKTI